MKCILSTVCYAYIRLKFNLSTYHRYKEEWTDTGLAGEDKSLISLKRGRGLS